VIISTSGPVSAVYLYFSLHQFSFLKLYKFSDASHHSLLSVKVNSHCMRCGAVCRWLVSVCLSVCLCRSQVGVCIEMAARIDLGFFYANVFHVQNKGTFPKLWTMEFRYGRSQVLSTIDRRCSLVYHTDCPRACYRDTSVITTSLYETTNDRHQLQT